VLGGRGGASFGRDRTAPRSRSHGLVGSGLPQNGHQQPCRARSKEARGNATCACRVEKHRIRSCGRGWIPLRQRASRPRVDDCRHLARLRKGPAPMMAISVDVCGPADAQRHAFGLVLIGLLAAVRRVTVPAKTLPDGAVREPALVDVHSAWPRSSGHSPTPTDNQLHPSPPLYDCGALPAAPRGLGRSARSSGVLAPQHLRLKSFDCYRRSRCMGAASGPSFPTMRTVADPAKADRAITGAWPVEPELVDEAGARADDAHRVRPLKTSSRTHRGSSEFGQFLGASCRPASAA